MRRGMTPDFETLGVRANPGPIVGIEVDTPYTTPEELLQVYYTRVTPLPRVAPPEVNYPMYPPPLPPPNPFLPPEPPVYITTGFRIPDDTSPMFPSNPFAGGGGNSD
jgi:hypothetical protein